MFFRMFPEDWEELGITIKISLIGNDCYHLNMKAAKGKFQ